MRLYDPAQKPRGIRRLKRKAGQAADTLVHGWLHVPARGQMTVRRADGSSQDFPFDAHQSAYLAFASRECHGGYERLETLFLDAMLAKSGTFFDIGANWGYFTLLAATHPGFRGRIVAFEILDEMNAAIRRMIEHLGLENVTVMGCGLSDTSGEVAIGSAHAAQLTRVIDTASDRAAQGRRAKVTRLDALDLSPPDIIKIDVEDHEPAVLRGGENLLARNKPLILFERRYDTPDQGNGHAVTSFLRRHGYALYRLREHPGKTACIDLQPLEDDAPPALENENLVAVAVGDEGRWFA